MFGAIRHMGRLLKVGYTLLQHDALTDLLAIFGGRSRALQQLKTIRRVKFPGQHDTPETNLGLALQSLGPSFIKFGQALATRPDLVGIEVATDLMRLQDRVPPFPGEEAVRIIEEELGGPLSDFYRDFDLDAVAAASMAQVHRAVTTDGRLVAVKVLRPDIEKAFARDLDSFKWLARKMEFFFKKTRRLRPAKVIETIEETIAVEMDFRYEAAAASELKENMAHNPAYRVPDVDWVRTARRVLTTSWVEGVPFSDTKRLAEGGYDRRKLAETLVQAFLSQALNDGVFHADLHQGNLFACEGDVITAIDFGIMGRIDRKTRRALAEILHGFIIRDYDKVARAHFEIGYVPPDQSLVKFKQALRAIGDPVVGKPVHEISIGRLLTQLFETTETFNMQTQPQLLLLQKTMVTVEGVALNLYPDINMWNTSRPIIESWMKENVGLRARLMDFAETTRETLQHLPKLIEDIDRIAENTRGLRQYTPENRKNGWLRLLLPGLTGGVFGGLLAAMLFYMLFLN